VIFDIYRNDKKKRTLGNRGKNDLWIKARKKCEACDCKLDSPLDGHVGHKKAYSLGGSLKDSNIAMLCMPCNNKQKTIGWQKFLEKYSKIEPTKYKKAYAKCINDKKKSEVEKINKEISKLKIEIIKYKKNITKSKTINNNLDKLKIKLDIINEKYKLLIVSTKTTPKKIVKKVIKKITPIKKKVAKKPVTKRK
jgi:hypothetical protein